MSESSLVTGAIYRPRYPAAESASSANITQEIIITPANLTREIMLLSEKSLMSVWLSPAEEEAWKDL